MKRDIKPSDIMTRTAFENAITLVMATGGSTNAVGGWVGRVWGGLLLMEGLTNSLPPPPVPDALMR
jgi:hypothetical protein